jgi:hypothetical protein
MTSRDQAERATRHWALVVHLDPPASRRLLKAARSILRIKSFEVAELERRLPGPVRFGARVDLEPLLARLLAAGVQAEIVLTSDLEERPESS